MVIENPIIKGKFVKRINRFLAYVEIDGEVILTHVPNTGRCKELFVPGATVVLEKRESRGRKTLYELEFVYKGSRLISIDSQVPNKVVLDNILRGKLKQFNGYDVIEREKTYENSKFDIRLSKNKEIFYIEVKGVTLENNGVVMFPDAPTERGAKHMLELKKVKESGMRAAVIFLVQMDDVLYFTPNVKTDKKFASALKDAVDAGVEAYAFCCDVKENFVDIKREVEIRF
ncbi:DNA/RNA nuclease SfsA [Thermoanaerobacterium thermosaccharolyticum]|uniref:Sugar fermentation stimulation protein homolog n=2 Tax=Thermoanaerobacterium thermosaccharolyticum TaxID=1517 RepID=A0A231VJL9_THETR|nr:DNA/RNA nuclease SfsA [Thermoanaerobacterium thermosaccharolyticum]AGB18062.1 sugar fermentation stimulation protein [Thermoanaerobacterium thermosaccharolyticum M0795]OXT08297.1 DNA/RNA nuclease SfsA [Thermoanaerobacterium thermosaccharolyticum]